jgi:hypothetical protein
MAIYAVHSGVGVIQLQSGHGMLKCLAIPFMAGGAFVAEFGDLLACWMAGSAGKVSMIAI